MSFKKGDWIVYVLDSVRVSVPFQLSEDEKEGMIQDRRYSAGHTVSVERVRHLSKADCEKIISQNAHDIENLQKVQEIWKKIKDRLS